MGAPTLFSGIDCLSAEDQILFSRFGRGALVDVPHATVHEAFESIVDLHPRAIAAKYGDKTITYRELDATANRLANHLIESGLRPKQRVCLLVQRSFEMLVGIFAILKAGCQYVPIDGGVSSERALEHILKDAGAAFVLCLPKFEETARRHVDEKKTIICLGTDAEAFCSNERPRIQVSPNDGVYAIYTSGTPKLSRRFVFH
jgi:non-ribosomal peptide synthetase component F